MFFLLLSLAHAAPTGDGGAAPEGPPDVPVGKDEGEGAAAGAADGHAAVDVTAQAASPDGSPATLTVVPLGAEVAGETDLAGVLDRVPGTTIRRLGGLGDFAGVRLRGSTFQQVEFFLDGVPLNPNGDTVVDLSSLPVALFSDMLVYRGFAPARYGASAMGGVVDLLTTATAPAALGVSGGSWGTVHSWGATQRCLGQTDALLTFDQLHTDGDWSYFDDQGTDFNRFDDRTPVREHNRIDRASGLARVRTRFPGLTLSWMDAPGWVSQELTGTISNPSKSATWDSLRNLAVVTADTRGGSALPWRLRPRAWWLHRDETTQDLEAELGVANSWTRGIWNTAGVQLDATLLPARWLSTSVLLRGREDVFQPFNLLAEDASSRDGIRLRRGLSAALSSDAWIQPGLGTLTLSPVVQLDVLDNHQLGDVPFENMPVSPGSEDLQVFVMPRAGANWALVGPLSVRANAGWYARPPDLTELFGDQGVVTGNTDLVAERGFGLEAGAHLADTQIGVFTIGADVAYARQRVHDLITYVPNSQQTEHAVNLGEAYFRSLEGALHLGLEGQLGATHLGIGSDSGVTQILSRNLDTDRTYSDNQLPNVPPVDVTQTTVLSMSAPWLDSVTLSHTWSYTAATFTDAANQNASAPRDLHAVSLSVRPGRDLPTLQASVLNLFDVRGMAVDRNPLDAADDTLVVKPLTDFVGYPLPGRTVMITVRWEESPPE